MQIDVSTHMTTHVCMCLYTNTFYVYKDIHTFVYTFTLKFLTCFNQLYTFISKNFKCFNQNIQKSEKKSTRATPVIYML